MEEWETAFRPVTNHLDDNASFQNEDDEGIMFETFGEELDFVLAQEPSYVWTYHHGENNSTYITNGIGFINRLGYFVTTFPYPEGIEYFIQVEEDNYMCANCEEQWFGAAADLHYEKFSELGTDGKCAKCATMEELKELEQE